MSYKEFRTCVRTVRNSKKGEGVIHMEKEKLKELVEKLKDDDEYIPFFRGMLESHLKEYDNQKRK